MVIQDKPVVKGYEIHEAIGEGAYGVVYRARQPFIDREVAIKVIQPEFANQPEFIRRFESEARLIAQMEHLHIVPLYDYWRDPQGAYLVMRLMPGGNLAEMLLDGPLELTRAVQLIDQVASALQVAHQKGVVHRDLKPANILFDQAGNAYLSDFGIAKAISSQPGLTTTGAILGSPAYMSPEQVQSQSVSPQTDIYALGILLFEIMSGKHPFSESSSGSMLVKQVNEPLPLVKPSRPELPVEVDHVIQRATAKDPADRYADALVFARELRRALNLEISSPIALDKELVNPYKGLRAFQEADADDFFGRNALVEDLIARLSGPGEYSRFLAVVGPSGSGKSSVVKAGLIPALRRGGLPGSENWFYFSLQPGPYPLEELEIALLRSTASSQNIIEQLQRDSRGLIRSARLVLPDEKSQLCLVIDQFEELFTLVDDSKIRDQVMDLIYESISFPKSQLRVIITLRADFYDRPLLHDKFSRLIEARTALVLPLTNQELQSAIQSPAERAGAILEKGVVPAIISDVSSQPGGLPLLQYALTELFDRRSGRMLNCQSYGLIGGLAGALGGRAEQIYTSLDQQTQQTAKQLFLRLVTIGEGVDDTRRRISWSEVEQLPAEHLQQVTEAFGQARLLTFDHDPASREATIEVAHEALLKEWDRLAGWLDDSRGDLRMQRLLDEMAAEWQAADQDSSYLLRGTRLVQFEEWAAGSPLVLSAYENALLESSLRARQEQEIKEAMRRMKEQKQISIGLASQAVQELEGPHPERSVLLALEALENYPYTWQAEKALGQSVLENRLRLVLKLDNMINYAEWSIDGTKLLTSSKDGKIRIWDSTSGEVLRHISYNSPIFARWSPDNQSILTINEQWQVNVLDTETGLPRFRSNINEFGEEAEFMWSSWYPWSPSEDHFLISYTNGQVITYDAFTGEEVQSLYGLPGITQALWSPDGEFVASSSIEADQVIIWHVGTGEILHKFPGDFEDERVIIASWSPEGDWFATRGLGGVKIYDSVSGELELELATPEVWIWRAIWSPDGGKLLTSGLEDGTARIWEAGSGRELQRLSGLVQVRGSDWSKDGRLVAVGGDDAIIHIWDIEKDREIQKFMGTSMYMMQVIFSPDDNSLIALAAGNNTHLQVYDLSEATLRISLPTPSEGMSPVYWSPSGEQIASLSYENRLPNIWNALSGEKEMILEDHGDLTGAITWSPDGERMLTTCWDKKARIWNAHTGEKILTLRDHQTQLENGSWSPDGKFVVTADRDGKIIVWNSLTGEMHLTFTGHDIKVYQAIWSPAGSKIVSCDENGRAYIWDGLTGEVILKLFPDDLNVILIGACWSHDGKKVLLQSYDNIVHTFDTFTGERIQECTLHSSSYSISLSPDETRLLIGGMDGKARVYQTESGKELIVYDVGGGCVMAVYSPNGNQLLIGTFAGDLMILPTWHSPEELIDYAKQHKVFRQLNTEEREYFGLPTI